MENGRPFASTQNGPFRRANHFSGCRQRGLRSRRVAVTIKTATAAETARTGKTVTTASWHCILQNKQKGGQGEIENHQNCQNHRNLRITLSTAGNSMTGSERPSPEPLLKKEASPAILGGGENSGNALEASYALNYRAWGIPAVLSKEIPGNALRAFPGSFRNFSGISSGKSQPYWGYGPKTS